MSHPKYKAKHTKGFFDESFRLEQLTVQKDPLVKLKERIDFEVFRSLLEEAFHKEEKGIGGARPYDYVLMFKILILQRYYNISDDTMRDGQKRTERVITAIKIISKLMGKANS